MRKYRINLSKYPSFKNFEKKEVILVLKTRKRRKEEIIKIKMFNIKENIYEADVKKNLKVNEISYIINISNNEIELKKDINNLDNRIAILSTMSSGKSTLINALLGKDILPSENQACTGKIFEVSNFKNEAEGVQVLKNNEVISDNKNNLDSKYLKKVNSEVEADKVKVNTKFCGIDREIILYDTPGVNNYMNSNHGEVTYDFLEKNSIKNIIYILNATQIGVTDDKKFLLDLKKTYSKNIVFLLNKIDTIDSKYEDKEVVIKNAKKYLKNIGFKSPKLIAISAHTAKIIRKGMGDNLETRREKMEFKIYVNSYLEKNRLKNKEINEKLIDQILNETGIKELELLINQGKI